MVEAVLLTDGTVLYERGDAGTRIDPVAVGMADAAGLRTTSWLLTGDSINRADQWVAWRSGDDVAVVWSGIPECRWPVAAVSTPSRVEAAPAGRLAAALGAPVRPAPLPTGAAAPPAPLAPSADALAWSVGLAVADIRAGAVSAVVEVDGIGTLVDVDGDRPLPPASTAKLFTASAALSSHGPTATLDTTVHLAGPRRYGIQYGDLVIGGAWDPTFGIADLEAMAAGVAERGVHRLTGDVLVHQPAGAAATAADELVPSRYGPLQPLAVDGNQWACGDEFFADPAAANAALLVAALERAGVEVDGRPGVTAEAPTGRPALTHSSVPVAALTARALRESNNLMAEHLQRSVPDAGALPFDPWTHGALVDGTGLDQRGAVSARRIVELLGAATTSDWGAALLEGMARPCEPGTFRDRLCEPGIAEDVRLKSGTLEGTAALAGTVRTSWGAEARFAVVVRQPWGPTATRSALDEVVRAIHRGTPRVADRLPSGPDEAYLHVDGDLEDPSAARALLAASGAAASTTAVAAGLQSVTTLDVAMDGGCGGARGAFLGGDARPSPADLAATTACAPAGVLGHAAVVRDGEMVTLGRLDGEMPLVAGDVIRVAAGPGELADLEVALLALARAGLRAVPLPARPPWFEVDEPWPTRSWPRPRDAAIELVGWPAVPVGAVDRTGDHGAELRWSLQLDPSLGLDAAGTAAEVTAALHHPRGWARQRRLVQVEQPALADIRILIAGRDVVKRLCTEAGLEMDRPSSCWTGRYAAIDGQLWRHGVPWFDDLATYRDYAINHEVGHGVGRHHERCPGAGEPAPVMVQQTLGLDGCLPNPWPFPGG